MRSQNLQNRIVELFSIFVAQVKGHTAMGRTDINRIAETVLIPILKEVYGYRDLKNLNDSEGDNNYPAIDLGDETAKIAIQVTATSDSEKIKDTLRGFVKHEFYQTYERVQIYILTEKQKSYSGRGFQEITQGKIQFDTKQDILDSRDLLKQISIFQVEQLQRICDTLEANFGESIKLNHPAGIPSNLPRSGVVKFVGRDQKLQDLHSQLQQNDRIAITAIAGMGGIGKTELALQYAITQLQHQTYPAGLCWLTCRAQEIATQIVSFAKTKLLLTISDGLEVKEQVDLIWHRWPEGNALIVLDDVTDYTAISLYLPPPDPRFKVLITTRQNFGATVTPINIEELSDEDAIALLKSIMGEERIEAQRGDAQVLCKWVGNLPLGLELLGRFLVGKPDWAIAKLLERLESKRLAAKALIETESGMTATLGVAAALELSWTELSQPEQDLACLLGMFAVAPIPWSLVELCFSEVDSDDLEDWRDEGLRNRSLIKRVEQGTYQLHQVVQEFFRAKLQGKGESGDTIKSSFCAVMVAQAQTVDETPTLIQIERVRGAIAHLEETANHWLESLSEEAMIWPFVGIGRFYQGQGNYKLAEPPYLQALERLKKMLSDEHPDVATSLNNLALLYNTQGRYEEAEPLHLQNLELSKKVLGNEHPDVATSLNNLAALYYYQGRYEEAEPLYLQALELRKKMLGNEHPNVASSLDDLAALYNHQGRYEKAEPIFLQALELRKKVLGNEHPDVATSLNNLALLYYYQGRYEEAKPLYVQALELRQTMLGNDHPDVATSLNDLAALYNHQGRYEEAEPLFLQALELSKKVLGNENPDVATSLNNLAELYRNQRRYGEAEPLYLQALELRKKLLGNEHPDVAISLNNLALLYNTQGRYEEAELLYLQALELRKKVMSEDHPDVATSYFNLGGLYHQQGQYQKAKSLYLPALHIYQQRLGQTHLDTQVLLSWLNALPKDTEALPLEELGL
jgi:tetratricopeptide (TPR) repeat protein